MSGSMSPTPEDAKAAKRERLRLDRDANETNPAVIRARQRMALGLEPYAVGGNPVPEPDRPSNHPGRPVMPLELSLLAVVLGAGRRRHRRR